MVEVIANYHFRMPDGERMNCTVQYDGDASKVIWDYDDDSLNYDHDAEHLQAVFQSLNYNSMQKQSRIILDFLNERL